MAEHYFGLKDEIVVDTLKSSDFENNENVILVGGLVPQIYGKEREDIYRKTLDADLITPESISMEDFKDKFSETLKRLSSKNYQVQFKGGRNNYSMKIMNSQNKPDSKNFFLNLDYLDSNIYNFFNDYIKKQVLNSKDVEFKGSFLRVESLEELFPMKISRLMNKSKDSDFNFVGGKKFLENVLCSEFSDLALIDLEGLRKGLEFYQMLFSNGKMKSNRVNDYKIIKDLFDLSASARIIMDNQYDFDCDRYKENLERVLTPKL